MGGAGIYNKDRTNILKLSCNNTEVVSIKKISIYATCLSNNWVKLRRQPKLPMALNELRHGINVKLVNNEKDYLKCTSKPSYMWHKIFDNNLVHTGKYMFVEYSWNIAMIYSRNIRKKFPMKFWGIFPNNVPRILNIGIFPECPMNILRMLHAFF